MKTTIRRFAVAAIALFPLMLAGQEQSVRPGINDSFQNPNVEEFIERFERDGRDAYDHRSEILDAMRLKPGMDVADIGAGTGLFTRLFAPLVGPEGRVYAVDISERFVKHVEETAVKAGLENVVGVVCTAESVKLPPASIDLAFICDTYHHFEFPHKTMASIHRALRPGGQVILIDFHRIEGVSSEWVLNHVRAGQEVFTNEIEQAGFQQIEEKKELLNESYFVRFRKVPAAPAPECKAAGGGQSSQRRGQRDDLSADAAVSRDGARRDAVSPGDYRRSGRFGREPAEALVGRAVRPGGAAEEICHLRVHAGGGGAAADRGRGGAVASVRGADGGPGRGFRRRRGTR